MAGAIRTPATTPEYRDNFGRAMRRTAVDEEARVGEVVAGVACGRCGKVVKVGNECACSALRAGGAGSGRPCERCGRQTSSPSARLCDYCEYHRGSRRR